jgi:hypothetical protein
VPRVQKIFKKCMRKNPEDDLCALKTQVNVMKTHNITKPVKCFFGSAAGTSEIGKAAELYLVVCPWQVKLSVY